MKVKGFVRSRMRESRTYGSVRGGYRKVSVYSIVRVNMIIQQIRNATLKIMYGGITFLVDPWLQDQGTGFSAKAVRPEMQGITAIK